MGNNVNVDLKHLSEKNNCETRASSDSFVHSGNKQGSTRVRFMMGVNMERKEKRHLLWTLF